MQAIILFHFLVSLFFDFPDYYLIWFFGIFYSILASIEPLSSNYFWAVKSFLLKFSSSSSPFLASIGLSNSYAVSNPKGLKLLSLASFYFSEELSASFLEYPALSVNLLFVSSSSFNKTWFFKAASFTAYFWIKDAAGIEEFPAAPGLLVPMVLRNMAN